jgi:hypothetical protein
VTKTVRQSVFAGALVLLGIGGAWWWRAEAAPTPESTVASAERSMDVPANAAAPSSSGAPGATAAPPQTAATASAPAGLDALDEPTLMTRLRSAETADAALAVALAREGNRRFPESADAPERTARLVHALAAEDRGSEARGEAEGMVNHYPDSEWVRDVERFTGAHRHRNIRATADGGLETYDPPGGP